MKVVESFVGAKTGRAEDCEDSVVVTDAFAAVLDGATAKTPDRINGLTPGTAGATVVAAGIASLSPAVSAEQAFQELNDRILAWYREQGIEAAMRTDPARRITVSTALYSVKKREVWLLGDCHCLAGGEHYRNEKRIDRLLAEVRSLVLELELLKGRTIEDLSVDDVGRRFIEPLIVAQASFQNAESESTYSYNVLDGFLPPSKVPVVVGEIGPGSEVVLATDGYPELNDTLERTEAALREILEEDPLCVRRHKATKGMLKGSLSFDDRAYLRIQT